MASARNDHATRGRDPLSSTHANTVSPVNSTGVHGNGVLFSGGTGRTFAANFTDNAVSRFPASSSASSTVACHNSSPVSLSSCCGRDPSSRTGALKSATGSTDTLQERTHREHVLMRHPHPLLHRHRPDPFDRCSRTQAYVY